MKKKTVIAWTPKTLSASDCLYFERGHPYLYSLFVRKGLKSSWGDNWPPKKIKITIEEVK